MRLSHLAAEAARRDPDLRWRRTGSGDPEITGLAYDSRSVAAGDLFFCVPGEVTDGHLFVPAAEAAGAAALVVDRDVETRLPYLQVTDVRHAMGWLAAIHHGDPSADLDMVGITGTNGKTTTAHLVKEVLDHAGRPCGLVGTLTGARTTPEAPDLQRLLREMVDSGVRALAMEVSSHALVQSRVTGARFDVGVFTNLSPDHLDYHGTMDDYFEAKALLFRTGLVRAAVINRDDPRASTLIGELDEAGVPTVGYSQTMLEDVEVSLNGSAFTWRGCRITLALPGRFNMENALAAAEAVRFLGVADESIAAGLSGAGQVPGRFEVVQPDDGEHPTVIVDYSHTPAGIEQVLRAVREIDPEAIVCVVFGAGGDRDREKRPLMGAAAERGADHVVVTSDNPRSEPAEAIIGEILAGMEHADAAHVEIDRRRAIRHALHSHGHGDVVVVAGKGHETTQTIGDDVLPFDDRVVVRELVGRTA